MRLTVKRTVFMIVAVLYLLASLALTCARLMGIYTMVDPATGFFTQKAAWVDPVIYAFAVLTVLFLLFSLFFGVRFAAKEEKRTPNYPEISRTTSLTCGTRLIFSANSTPRIFISAFLGFSLISFSLFSLLELTLAPWEIVLQIIAILSGVYFILQYTPLLPLYSLRRTLCSLVPVIWSGVHLTSHFLSSSRIASGEYHNWQMVMLAFIALFFYLQSLFTTPKRTAYHFSFYYATGIIGAGLIFIFAVPTLLLSSFWFYSAHTQYTNLYALMSLIACALYILVFVFGAVNSLGKVENSNGLCDLPEAGDLSSPENQ